METQTMKEEGGPVLSNQSYLDGGTLATGWLAAHQDPLTDGLEWQFAKALNPVTAADVKLCEVSKPTRIFPACVHTNAGDLESKRHRLSEIYSSARFLHKAHFEAFVSNDLLLDCYPLVPQRYDPFLGNPLSSTASCTPNDERPPRCSLLGMAIGREGNEFAVLHTNGSRSSYSNRHHVAENNASKDVVLRFPTSIRQIESIPHSRGTTFAIRTVSNLTYLDYIAPARPARAKYKPSRWGPPVNFWTDDFAGQAPVDVCLSPFSSTNELHGRQAIVVDRSGGLWQILTENRRGALRSATSPLLDHLRMGHKSNQRSGFARVSYGLTDKQAVVALDDVVRIFDLRSSSADLTIYSISKDRAKITDMAKPTDGAVESISRMISTDNEVLWFDIRKPGEPVLRYKHRRDGDLTLSLASTTMGGVNYSVLWSRKSSAMTLFTYSANPPSQLLVDPCSLQPPTPGFQRAGVSLLPIATANTETRGIVGPLLLLETATDGSLYERQLVSEKLGGRTHLAPLFRHRQPEAAGVSLEANETSSKERDLKRSHVSDMRTTYANTFSIASSLLPESPAPTVLHGSAPGKDEAVMLIASEVISKANMATSNRGKNKAEVGAFSSDYTLDRSAISLDTFAREYQQLSICKEALYKFSLPPSLLGTDSISDPSAFADQLKLCYGMKSETMLEKPKRLREGISFACEQLAVDLALSKEVFSMSTPMKPDPQAYDESMSNFKKTVDFPNIQYGYFRPAMKKNKLPGSLAARALLSEWKLGADPAVRPLYVNPYALEEPQDSIASRPPETSKRHLSEVIDISDSQSLLVINSINSSVKDQKENTAEITDLEVNTDTTARSSTYVQLESQTSVTPSMPASHTSLSQGVSEFRSGRPSKKKKRIGGF